MATMFRACWSVLLVLGFHGNGAAQVTAWATVYGSTAVPRASAGTRAIPDGAGGVYIGGSSDLGSGTGSDLLVCRYSAGGALLWAARYDGPAHGEDYIRDLVRDGAGALYVSGVSPGAGTGSDGVLWKLDADGLEQWVRRFDEQAGEYDAFAGLAVAPAGGVYVTGTAGGAGSSAAVFARYDAAGNQVWLARHAVPGSVGNGGSFARVDSAGNLCVAGSSGLSFSGSSFTALSTWKYAPDGTRLWSQTYPHTGGSQNFVQDMALDAADNIHVCATTLTTYDFDFLTVKYDGGGQRLWTAVFRGQAPGDLAEAIAVSPSGDVIVTGHSEMRATTVFYDQNGIVRSVARFGIAYQGRGTGVAVALDGAGRVYVLCAADSARPNCSEYALVQYDAAGNERWAVVHGGSGAQSSQPWALSLDGAGNVHATGITEDRSVPNMVRDMLTLRYEPHGFLTYGAGLAGTAGHVPMLAGNGTGHPGSTATFQLANGLGGSAAFLGAGFQRTFQPLFGGSWYVAAPLTVFFVPLAGGGSQPGAGSGSFALPIPPDPALLGMRVDAQALVADPGAIQGVALTNGLELWIG
jgi:hypothetical protein